MEEKEKIIRQYYSPEGWMLVIRSSEGLVYHILRERYIENIYKNKYE